VSIGSPARGNFSGIALQGFRETGETRFTPGVDRPGAWPADDGRNRCPAIDQEVFAVNQNEREGQSMGRTTGASGEDAEQQQNRAIEGQEGTTGQKAGNGQSTGQGDTSAGSTGGWTGGSADTEGAGYGAGRGTGGESSGRNPQGSYSGQGDSGAGIAGGSDPTDQGGIRDTGDQGGSKV
jgi:hypothetical protein